MNINKIEIFFLCKNEQDNIIPYIIEVKNTLDKTAKKDEFNYTVILNGSIDQTLQRLLDFKLFKIQIIVLKNYGKYSKSVEEALIRREGHSCVILDGDGQFSPEFIVPACIQMDKGIDLVLGYRNNYVGSKFRIFGSLIFLFICKAIIQFDGDDINAGARAISNRFQIHESGLLDSSLANPQLWLIAKKKGFKVSYVKVNSRERKFGQTTINWKNPIRLLLNSTLDLIRFRMRFK